MTDPKSLIPRHKHDHERVEAVIALGYPAIASIVPQLLEWTQDPNWPVAIRLAKFLASIGEPIVGDVSEILAGADGGWKYACINMIIKRLPKAAAAQLTPQLIRLATAPTENDRHEEVDLAAKEALDWLRAATAL